MERPQGRTGHLSTTSLTRAFMVAHRMPLSSGLRTGLVCSGGTWAYMLGQMTRDMGQKGEMVLVQFARG